MLNTICEANDFKMVFKYLKKKLHGFNYLNKNPNNDKSKAKSPLKEDKAKVYAGVAGFD